ncbi:hypothetical protein GX50_05227 [[Emmonsia] crescens]|uniref:Uncharacterized protein n=1 Tax=[Emmonsia] crescens TaxID=73230 RepID=A0A2B7ZG20_9EURO|nr:hypothetical protein GX50_05227 [Emmonsia crescens]
MPRDRPPWSPEQWAAKWAAIKRGDPEPKITFRMIISDASPIMSKEKLEEITGPVAAEVEWARRGRSYMDIKEDLNEEKIKYCIVAGKQWSSLQNFFEVRQVLIWVNGKQAYGYFVPPPGTGDDLRLLVIGSVNC